uniref:Immediate early response 2b n=1 Tax=Mola mola TaxID=94237 RepID=A0A3Q3W402_MOLML
MEVSAEAKRIMVVALGKLYSSRTQRGGLRLHRSLLLTMVMKSARDMYHAAQATAETAGREHQQSAAETEATAEPGGAHAGLRLCSKEEVEGNLENLWPSRPVQHSRKRRGKAAAEPDFLPCKKAKLEQEGCQQPLSVSSLFMDYVNCGGGLGTAPSPISLQRAVAAC